MPPKRQKYWKHDGKEQAFLEQLLKDATVLHSDTPAEVQDTYSIFDGFSRDVFRKHWNLTKQKFNTGCELNFSFILNMLSILYFKSDFVIP